MLFRSTKKPTTDKPVFKGKNSAPLKSNTTTKKDILGNVKFNNGKQKKKNDQ